MDRRRVVKYKKGSRLIDWRCGKAEEEEKVVKEKPRLTKAIRFLMAAGGKASQKEISIHMFGGTGRGELVNLLNELFERGWARFLMGEMVELTEKGRRGQQ